MFFFVFNLFYFHLSNTYIFGPRLLYFRLAFWRWHFLIKVYCSRQFAVHSMRDCNSCNTHHSTMLTTMLTYSQIDSMSEIKTGAAKNPQKTPDIYWNGNVILTKFLSLAAPKVVILLKCYFHFSVFTQHTLKRELQLNHMNIEIPSAILQPFFLGVCIKKPPAWQISRTNDQ